MRILIGDYIETASHSFRANRMRTFLTTIGVAIGVASITTILALSQGVTSEVARQVSEVGGNVAVVRPGYSSTSSVMPISSSRYNTSSLSAGDVETIKGIDPSLNVAPMMTIDGVLKSKNFAVTTTMLATTPSLTKTTSLPIEFGGFLDANSKANMAVVGQQLAINLFGTDNPIGQQFTSHGQTFTVIGVLKYMNNPVNYNDVDFDNIAIINLGIGQTLFNSRTQIQQINIQAASSAQLDAVLGKIQTALASSHGEQDFRILTGSDVAATTSQTFNLVVAVMAAIAAISLVVGGIGVMNIMLVGVAERTREIGIRKSVGASNTTIVSQFLIESLLLSIIGGLLGVVGGVVLSFTIALWLYFTPVFTWQIIVLSLGVSIGVGVLFGLYPAIRAASKNPIESLRQYR